ncbi:MAG: monooxygenase [Pseudorhodoplanes sp.]
MIAAIVTFVLPSAVTRERWSEIAASAAPRYENVPGPVRKQFLFNHGLGGGVCLWESRAAAEICHDGTWRESIARVAQSDPRIVYFETPVVVDKARVGIAAAA